MIAKILEKREKKIIWQYISLSKIAVCFFVCLFFCIPTGVSHAKKAKDAEGKTRNYDFNFWIIPLESSRSDHTILHLNNFLFSEKKDYDYLNLIANITGKADRQIGIRQDKRHNKFLKIGKNTTIKMNGNFSIGVFATKSKNYVLENNGTIKTNKDFSHGVFLLKCINTKIKNNGKITVGGSFSAGISLKDCKKGRIKNYGKIETKGKGEFLLGIDVRGKNTEKIKIYNHGTILCSSKKSIGIFVGDTEGCEIRNTGKILVDGSDSCGIKFETVSKSSITSSGNIEVVKEGSVGISVYNSETSEGKELIHIEDGGNIKVKGKNSVGIRLQKLKGQKINHSGKIILTGDNSIGIEILGGCKSTTIDVKGTIESNNSNSGLLIHSHPNYISIEEKKNKVVIHSTGKLLAAKKDSIAMILDKASFNCTIMEGAEIRGDIVFRGIKNRDRKEGYDLIFSGNGEENECVSYDSSFYGFYSSDANETVPNEDLFGIRCLVEKTRVELNGKKNLISFIEVKSGGILGGYGKIKTKEDDQGIIISEGGTLESSLDVIESPVEIRTGSTMSVVNDTPFDLSKGNIEVEEDVKINYVYDDGTKQINVDELNGKVLITGSDDSFLEDVLLQVNGYGSSATLKYNGIWEGDTFKLEGCERIAYSEFSEKGITDKIAKHLDNCDNKASKTLNFLRIELDKIMTEEGERQGLSMITPITALSGTMAAADASMVFSDQFGARRKIKNADDDFSLWVNSYGSIGEQKIVDEFSGYDWETYGSIFGIEKTSDNFTVGVGIGTSRTTTKNQLFNGDIETLNLGLYAEKVFYDNWFIDGVLSYSDNSSEGERKFRESSSNKITNNVDSEIMTVNVAMKRKFALTPKFTVIPKIGIKAFRVSQNSYIDYMKIAKRLYTIEELEEKLGRKLDKVTEKEIEEEGYEHSFLFYTEETISGTQVEGVNWSEINSELGADLVCLFSEKTILRFGIAWLYKIDESKDGVGYFTPDSDEKQILNIDSTSKNSLKLNLGLNFLLSEKISAHLNSHFSLNEDINSIHVNGEIAYNF